MKRWLRKCVAITLALSMIICSGVVFAEDNEVKGIKVVEIPVYDAAVALMDNVVLLENGHWGNMVTNEDTNEQEAFSDVTAETKIVFIDSNGNKKVISNKDANGKQIFDAVHPIIEGLDGSELIRIVKDGAVAYINPDGTFLTQEGKFYKNVYRMSGNQMLVSEDGVEYKVEGYEGSGGIKMDKFQSADIYGENLFIKYKDKFVISDVYGKTIKEYPRSGSIDEYISVTGSGVVNIHTEKHTVLLNADLEVLKESDTRFRVYNTHIDHGYVFILDDAANKYYLMDANTGEIAKEYSEYPAIQEKDIIIAKDNNGKTVLDLIGEKISINIDQLVGEIALAEGFTDYDSTYQYSDGYLLISLRGYGMTGKSVTYILSKESDYDLAVSTKVEGYVGRIYKSKRMFTTEKVEGSDLEKIYTLDGELVKDFTSNTKNVYSTYDSDIDDMPSVLDIGYTYVEGKRRLVVICTDGSIISTYKNIKNIGHYLIGETVDDKLDIISDNGVVATYNTSKFGDDYNFYVIGKWIYGLKYSDYYAVVEDNICNLYDANGKRVEELSGTYSGIGPCESITGNYQVAANGNDSYYSYANDNLKNGLCVTRSTDSKGNHKYGVVMFNATVEKGDVNGSGKIDAADALLVLKYSAKISELSNPKLADVNKDGAVNAADALLILKLAAHIIDSFE